MKFIAGVIIFIMLTFSVNSQIISNYGFKFGIGTSNQSFDYPKDISIDFDNKTGISARIFIDFFNFHFLQI